MTLSRIFLSILIVFLSSSFLCAQPTFARDDAGGAPLGRSPGGGAPLGESPGAPAVAGEIKSIINPLGSNSIQEFFLKIMQILILFAVPLIVFYIILAGFKYVTARGNTEQISEATSALTWALVGGVLILGAEIILKVIQGTVTALQ